MKMDEIIDGEKEKERQAARASLREGFITTLLGLQGMPCRIQLLEMNSVEGIFKGCDMDFQELLFDDLKTPYSTLPHSIVRASDILYLQFPEK